MLLPEDFDSSLIALKKRGVLKEVKPGSLPRQIMSIGGQHNLADINVCVLSCCDGHQFADTTRHTFQCCEVAKKELGLESLAEDCFHWKTENGGPFVLSVPQLARREYKGKTDYVDRNVLASMDEGMSLKRLNVVLLIGHAVCGKMKPLVHSLEEYTSYMATAKSRIMSEFNLKGEQVITQLQCHRPIGRRTLHVDYSEAAQLRAVA